MSAGGDSNDWRDLMNGLDSLRGFQLTDDDWAKAAAHARRHARTEVEERLFLDALGFNDREMAAA